MNGPLVSIVTPSYNQGQFLETTIRSVLGQDYSQLEYIVVDGGSTDCSVEIIEKYAESISWWVSEPDQGQADAINKGFQKAQGEILGWINSDDYYLPGAVKEAVGLFAKFPEASFVYGNAYTADAEGNLLNPLRFDQRDLLDFLRFKMICQPAVFFRKQIAAELDYLDPSYDFFLDHHFWIRLYRQAPSVFQERDWAVSRYHDQAKNVYLAETCGEEAYRILEWAKQKDDMAVYFQDYERIIWGGAHQIYARYLLDAQKPYQALRKYLSAYFAWPFLLFESGHRFLFALLSLIGLDILGVWFRNLKHQWVKLKESDSISDKWPES
jgi:glycosyltransferase involved in cell wall biosynthesis